MRISRNLLHSLLKSHYFITFIMNVDTDTVIVSPEIKCKGETPPQCNQLFIFEVISNITFKIAVISSCNEAGVKIGTGLEEASYFYQSQSKVTRNYFIKITCPPLTESSTRKLYLTHSGKILKINLIQILKDINRLTRNNLYLLFPANETTQYYLQCQYRTCCI